MTRICKVTDKILGRSPRLWTEPNYQSAHMSLIHHFSFLRESSNFLARCLVTHLKDIGKCPLISKCQAKRQEYTEGEKTSFRWLMVLKLSVLCDQHGRLEGHQSGCAVNMGAAEEGLRSGVLEWSRIWQGLISKLSCFGNWQGSATT